jgi:predicted protein tyrosine phosphatase
LHQPRRFPELPETSGKPREPANVIFYQTTAQLESLSAYLEMDRNCSVQAETLEWAPPPPLVVGKNRVEKKGTL